MAFSASGLYYPTWRDILDTTQLAINFDATTHKCALHTDTLTPNFTTDATWSNTNEVSSANYTTGGTALAGTSVTDAGSALLTWDSTTNPSWTPVTFTAHGALIYNDSGADELICAVTFGADYTATAGTFTVTWNAAGIFTIDLTP